MDDIVHHGSGTSDLAAELDLHAAQVSAQLRAARNYRLLITDKTVMNVTAGARLVHCCGRRLTTSPTAPGPTPPGSPSTAPAPRSPCAGSHRAGRRPAPVLK
jgi:hypothetical protein